MLHPPILSGSVPLLFCCEVFSDEHSLDLLCSVPVTLPTQEYHISVLAWCPLHEVHREWELRGKSRPQCPQHERGGGWQSRCLEGGGRGGGVKTGGSKTPTHLPQNDQSVVFFILKYIMYFAKIASCTFAALVPQNPPIAENPGAVCPKGSVSVPAGTSMEGPLHCALLSDCTPPEKPPDQPLPNTLTTRPPQQAQLCTGVPYLP